MDFRRLTATLFLLALLVSLSGCGGSPSATEQASSGEPTKADDDKPLLEPFSPPPLVEIDEKANWVDVPVEDATALLKAKQAAEPPRVSVPEALKLRNTSPENNAKILSALGRLPASEAEVDANATMNMNLEFDVGSTNPILAHSASEQEVQKLISIGLVGFDWTMRPFPDNSTVARWQTSKDQLMDKVTLRDDLTWSDGKPITAYDFEYSFQVIMDKRVAVPAVRSGTDRLRWVAAYDDHTIVFFHKEALATNIWNISFPIIPKHIYEKTRVEDPTLAESAENVRYENEPVTSGPYSLTSRLRGQEIVLSRRESWYQKNGKQVRDKPNFKTVRFRVLEDPNTILLALKKGEIDTAVMTTAQWTTQTDDEDFYRLNTKASGVEWTYFYFGWNAKRPYFSDVRVRKAMSYAMNYDELMKKTLYGLYERSYGIFASDSWMAQRPKPTLYQQDLDKAEELLDEAGWTDHDGDGVRDKQIGGRTTRFEFTILCSNIPERVAVCTLLKECLDKIGVVCNVRPIEATVLMDKMMKRDFDANFGGWGAGADPDTSGNLWETDEQRNYVGFSSAEVDRLFKEGRHEFDRDKRAAIYGRIAEIVYDDQPCTFLYQRSSFYGFNRSLRGYNYSPRGPFSYSPGFDSIWKALP